MSELLETRAIEQLMIRYLDRIDANDPVGSAACFAPDGVGLYWGEYRGREAIAERLAGILDGFFCTSHHISNVAVQLDGDRATAMAYVYAFHRTKPDAEQMHYIGRWVDELVKIDGEWLFARREVVGVGSWRPGDPDQAKHDRFPGHPGRLDR
jgi:uncharacterized protein (TIGR02246 family)